MASARLPRRRRETADPRSSLFVQNKTLTSEFEQIVPIQKKRVASANQTRHLDPTAWRDTRPKSAKKKTNRADPSEPLASNALAVPSSKHPGPSGTPSSNSQSKSPTDVLGGTSDPDRYRDSIVASSIALPHQNQKRVEPTYPPTVSFGPRILDQSCSCEITMRYRSDPAGPKTSQNSRRDEVTIFQVTNGGSPWIVFKGFLKAGDSFILKSQRSMDDRFHLRFEINGSLDTTLSSCCEHPYRHGGRIDDSDSSFWIENVAKCLPCPKCHDNVDALSPSPSYSKPPQVASKTQLSSNSKEWKPATELQSESSTDEESEVGAASIASDKPAPKPHSSSVKPSSVPAAAALAKPVSTAAPTFLPPVSHQPQTIPTPAAPPPPTAPQKALPAAGSKFSIKQDDNEVNLLQYVNDTMQKALAKPKHEKTIPSREIGNVENFTVLCINQNEVTDLNLLRSIVNSIRTMDDSKTLTTLLASCTDEKIIVIIALNQAEAILPELQSHTSVQCVYLLSEKSHPPAWINDYDKIIGIYRNTESIRDHLIKTLPRTASRMIPMEIVAKDSTEDQPFTYCQLLKETMLCEDEESNLKKDMLTYCRIHYADNPEALHEIDEFEESFTDAHSIQWYTRYCFLTKILSRAVRTQEIDLLFKMRYFIQSLRTHIRAIALKEPTTVYAVVDIDQNTMQNLQKSLNGLIIFRSFLSTTFERPPSSGHPNENTQGHVVLSIRLGSGCAANIEALRSAESKVDVLINFDTVFRLTSIDETRIVHLESVPHDNTHFQQLTEPLRTAMKAPVVILQLMKLLIATDHYWEGDYITEMIYQDKSFHGDGTLMASLAATHHMLGNVDEANGDPERARYQFFKSLRAFQTFLPHTHQMLSPSYNNIGSMYYKDDHHEQAIKFHEMALECQMKSTNPDADSVATYSANIGAVYVDEKKYSEAIKPLQRAVTIMEKMSTKEKTKGLISIYQKLSSCLWRTDRPEEALEYYKRTLDLQLSLPNPLPHPLSVTYYNLSTAYGRVGDYDQAVACAEKSVKYLKEIDENHPELKENQAQLEGVRQKQWLKQVLLG